MIDFSPTEEQKMLVDAINKYAINDVRPVAHDADETGTLPVEVVQKGWEFGLLPAGIPEAYGGFGEHSAITNVLAAEELAYGDLAVAMAVLAPGLLGLPVHFCGTEGQKRHLLPALAEPALPAFTAALIEPTIKFDPGALQTTATRDGAQYVLKGVKTYVPLAETAQMMVVYARDSETGKIDGYLVEGSQEGLQRCEREKLMGVRALPTYTVRLDQVRVDADCRIGGEQGTCYERLLSHSRVALAAMAVGVARGAYEYARNYAKERVQFGAPIATKQAIAFVLAEMAIEIDAARLLTWEAAWLLDSDATTDGTPESYLAKEYADRMVLTVTDGAVQVLGGHGYVREHPVERWLRNGRGFATFDGMAMV